MTATSAEHSVGSHPAISREVMRRSRFGAGWAALAVGAFASDQVGIGLVLTCAAVLGGLAYGLHKKGRQAIAPLGAVAVLVPWLVVRHNSWLAISIVSTVALVIVLTTLAQHTNQSATDFRLFSTTRSPPQLPSYFTQGGQIESVVRGVALATPILWIMWTLLASADDVFASIADPGHIPFARLGLVVVAAAVLLKVYDHAAVGGESVAHQSSWTLGSIETTVVLGLLNVLFAAFVFVRIVASTNLPETDEEFRATVRSGFFQLLGVAALTVVLVLWLRQVHARGTASERRRFTALAISTVGLAAVIDVFAMQTIAVYVRGSFLSPLRYWSFGFGVWLLFLLGAVALRVLGVRSNKNWMTAAIVGTWIVFVLVVAVSNPDLRIAEYNFANPQTSERGETVLAVNPLMWLSEDATPTIVENLEFLRPMSNDRYDRMVAHLCSTPEADWREFNFGRADAETALKSLC